MNDQHDSGGRHPLKTPALIAACVTAGVAIKSQHLMFTVFSGALVFAVVFGLTGVFYGGKKVISHV